MNIARYVGNKVCMDDNYAVALQSADAIIDPISDNRNVTIEFTCDERPLEVKFRASQRDLVELAAAVFVGDEIVTRKDGHDGWSREFNYIIPVKEPEKWIFGDSDLCNTLEFLAGDYFTFSWYQRKAMKAGRKHRVKFPKGFDTVCLFSGGIDSLLGAYSLLKEGRKVLLVGHQAEGVTAKAQKDLVKELLSIFPGAASLIQCRVARAKTDQPSFVLPSKVEDTHRPRSFLFLSLAIAVANTMGIREIFLPENGLIALNPPLTKSRLGSHSTRTAHPIYLVKMLNFLKKSDLYDGSIRNPFLYLSKTDMLRALDPKMITAVLRSVSCSRPFRYQDRGVRHCGYCVPCMYRRAAMMVCGLDRPTDYAYDFTVALPKMTTNIQADVRAVTSFAQKVRNASNVELELLILSHGYFSPDIGGQIGPKAVTSFVDWADMLRRWASDFLTEVEPRCSEEVKQMLALTHTVAPSQVI